MFLRLRIWLFLVAVIAANRPLAVAQSPAASHATAREALVRTRPSLAGSLENNRGQLRLNLTNNAAREFRGTARLSLGSEAEQRELGQVALALPPQETILFLLTNAAPIGEQYTLLIHDEHGTLVFYKIARLKQVADDARAIAVALTPIASRAQPTAPLVATSSPNVADESVRLATQVQVQARLLADEAAANSFIVSFELSSQRPVYNATLTITAGKHQERKPARVNRQTHYQFKLPQKIKSERIGYTLTAKDGRVLARGEVDLAQLMADDLVTVGDIRTDRSIYEAGETARVTMLLEGKARQGYRLEVLARDGQGQVFFREQKQATADETANTQEFLITLAGNIRAPLVFEFKIFDLATGLLFDSGQRELPLNANKLPRRS